VLRNEYIRVWLGETQGSAFLSEYATGLKSEQETRILGLLEAEMMLAKAYTSEGWFHEDVDRKEPRYAVATAAYALKIAENATGTTFSDQFRSDLGLVSSGISTLNGTEMYDSIVDELIDPKPPAETETAPETGEAVKSPSK